MKNATKKQEDSYLCKKCGIYQLFCEHTSLDQRCKNHLCHRFYNICEKCYEDKIKKLTDYKNSFCSNCDAIINSQNKNDKLCYECHESKKNNPNILIISQKVVDPLHNLLVQIKKTCDIICKGSTRDPAEFFKNNFKSILENRKKELDKELKNE